MAPFWNLTRIADPDAGEGDRRLHRDPGRLVHPENRLVGVADEDPGEGRVRPVGGHPLEVGPEVLLGVGLDVVEEAGKPIFDVRQQPLEGARRSERDPEQPSAEIGVAAPFGLRRLLEHHHPLRAFLAGGVGGGEGGVSRPHHDHVKVGHREPVSMASFSSPTLQGEGDSPDRSGSLQISAAPGV